MTTNGPTSAAEVVRQAARDGEIDRYFAALMAPVAIRDDVMAIAAFSAVIGHIPQAVHEPMMGEVRLQWWRDALLSGRQLEATGHPIADAVAAARTRHGLPDTLLNEIIDAVFLALAAQASEASEDASRVLAQFESRVFALTAHVHAGAPVAGCDELFEHAGAAYGLARALCRLPVAIASGWPPLSLVHPANDGGARAALVADIPRLHDIARRSLAEVRRRQGELAPPAIAALAPVAMVEPYLEAQSRVIATLLDSSIEILPLKRIWRIWRTCRRRRL